MLSSRNAIAFLDAYPVTNGHTLVVPRRHVSSIYELPANEQSELRETVLMTRALLMDRYKVDLTNPRFSRWVRT